jgi:hypothetical protein
MRQKNKNHQNQGSIDKKFDFFSPVPKSHTQMGSLSAKNASKKFSRLGTFKEKVSGIVQFSIRSVRQKKEYSPTTTSVIKRAKLADFSTKSKKMCDQGQLPLDRIEK